MKFKNLIFVLFLFMSQFSFAHKDISIYENYGNVKIYMRTGFRYAEIDKFRVLAKLSDILLKQLNEKDTILLKYIHNYTKSRTQNYFLNYDKTGFAYSGTKKIIIININKFSLNINECLKLIEYAIKNKDSLSDFDLKVKLFEEEAYQFGDEINITSEFKINEILRAKASKEVKIALKNEIEIFNNVCLKMVWKNFKYYLFKTSDLNNAILIIDEDKFYSFELFDDGLIIFPKNDYFNYINSNGRISKKHHIDSLYAPFYIRIVDEYNLRLNIFKKNEHYLYNIKEDKLVKNI